MSNETRLAEIEAEIKALEEEKTRLLPRPKKGDEYWLSDPTYEGLASSYTWADDEIDRLWLKRGLVFRTEEKAVEASKTMLRALGWESDQ